MDTTKLLSGKFTAAYESIIVFGEIEVELGEEERLKVLRLLVKKYSEGYEEVAKK